MNSRSCETTGTLEQRPFHCSSSCAFLFFLFSFPWLSPLLPLPTPPNSELLLCWKDTFPDVITKSKCCSANRCCERPNMWIQWHKFTSWSWENMRHTFSLFIQWMRAALSLCSLKWWAVTVRNYLTDVVRSRAPCGIKEQKFSHTLSFFLSVFSLLVCGCKDGWTFKQLVSNNLFHILVKLT